MWSTLGLALLGSQATLPYTVTEVVTTSTPGNRRSILRRDPLEHQLATGQPATLNWAPAKANKDGWFEGRGFSGGYAKAELDWPKAETVLLEANGHTMVYVNGEPRAGDPYGYGYASLPIQLKAGKNELLFAGGRGRLRVQLVAPPAPVSLDLRDATLPDLRRGAKGAVWGAVIVRNAEGRAAGNLMLTCGDQTTRLPSVPPLSIRKVPFRISPKADGKYSLVLSRAGKELHRQEIALRWREPGQSYKRTFLSDIDGSLQYFGVNPSTQKGANQALFLTLHGASVEGIGQADAYAPKTWGHLVAPTNRRPYGFDWEEVGRLDALEVLGIARKELATDPRKTYLTGHSMGGHGTWQLGAHFPSLFAAIAPCAGWISFATYGGGGTYEATGIEGILGRANSPSETLKLKQNYASVGIFVLHGDADSTVPPSEPRTMRKELEGIATRLQWHEEPGQGHWYDTTPEAGADCVDWPGIFDLFANSRVPAVGDLRQLNFTTVNPGISSDHHWLSILQQEKALVPSQAVLTADPHRGAFHGTTTNILRMKLRLNPLLKKDKLILELDGQKLEAAWPKGDLELAKTGGSWNVAAPLAKSQKGPHRNGGFKDVFRNRVMFVYGTAGTAEENRWAYAKARFDAESFWYRGNAAVDVVPDTSPLLAKEPNRNILLYGNAQTNSAWAKVLDGEVTVTRGLMKAAGKSVSRDDLAVLFLRPRLGSEIASVGVVAPTGKAGAVLLERVPYFTSGAAMPDFVALTPKMLLSGADGVAGAGFFGNDWSTGSGDFVWAP